MAFWESGFGGSAGGSYRLRVNVDVIGQEVGNNRSLIRYNAWIEKVGGGTAFNNNTTYGNTNINGYNPGRSIGGYNFGSGTGQRYNLAVNEDYWVGHDGNGNANPYFGANFDMANSPYITSASTGGNMGMPSLARVPDVQTYTPINPATNSITARGNVSFAGNTGIIERGIVWGTSANPTTGNNKIATGGSTGALSANITGLTPATTYHYRAFARNSQGTTYGANQSFTTYKVPVISTNATTALAGTTATANGTLTDVGSPTITEKGFVYSTTPNPTTANTKVIVAGTTAGAFSSNLTGLSPSATYYIRAYAINATGTTYGNEVNFLTVVPPTVTTEPATDVTTTSAIGHGEATAAGGGTISETGFVYGTTNNPTIADGKKIIGSGLGLIDGSITGLSPSVTYYYRAYAINEGGAGYGLSRTFSTAQTPPLQPSNLTPTGGFGVDDLTPTLIWQYNPGSANDTQKNYQVIVYRASDSVVIWDSGKITASTLTVDVPGTANLVYNVDYQWKVRSWNQADQAGPYSTLAAFKTSHKPVVAMTYPTEGQTIVTNVPIIAWTYTDAESTAQARYRVRLFDGSTTLYDTGWLIGTATTHQIPDGILNNLASYQVEVTVEDGSSLLSIPDTNNFDIEFLAPALPTVSAIQDVAGIVTLNITQNKPPIDGWFADRINVYKKNVGETNYTPFVMGYDIPTRIIDTAEAITGWAQTGVARAPIVSVGKYGTNSLGLGVTATGDGIYTKTVAITDLSKYDTLGAWIFITNPALISSIDINLESSSGNYYTISVPAGTFAANTWSPIFANKSVWTITGNPSIDSITKIQVILRNATGSITAGNVRIDQIVLTEAFRQFTDYETANSQRLQYAVSAFSTEAQVSTGLAEAQPITIKFTEKYVNTYLVPLDNRANTVKGWMDGTKAPSWNDNTETRYFVPKGGSKPIVVTAGHESYIDGSIELRFFDARFEGQGLIGAEQLVGIKNTKPLLLRTWWGRNYYISIDGTISTTRAAGIGWYSTFNFTEIQS